MNTFRLACGALLMLSSVVAVGDDARVAVWAPESLEPIASAVEEILVREKMNNAFDLFQRLSDHGITWQPSLLAPNDLVGRLDDEQLRMYAGIKLFDALYAATFRQPHAVAEAVAVIEAVQDRLELRSQADISGGLLAVLGRAAADPRGVDLNETFEALATSFIGDVPALMANPRSAEYLVDSLFGLWVEKSDLQNHFHLALERIGDLSLERGDLLQLDRGEWEAFMLDLLQVAGPVDVTTTIAGQTIAKDRLIARHLAALQSDTTIEETAATTAQWMEVNDSVAAVRAAILTPAQ